jgi:hypothetical protein
MTGRWSLWLVRGAAVLYGLLAVVCLAAWGVADDPLGAVPAFILGLPWSPLTSQLTRLAPASFVWLTAVLALPLVVNLGLLGLLHRWLVRQRTA